MPVVRVANADEGIDLAKKVEHGVRHTAKNLDHLSRMDRVMDCSIFVKNAPSHAGLGYGSEGFCSFTIASPTGEGLTSPISFSRSRRPAGTSGSCRDGEAVKLGRVVGTAVATCRYEGLEGVKLLVVQPLDSSLKADGRPQVAADATAQAGPGEFVFVVASREVAQALPEVFVPVDLAITGSSTRSPSRPARGASSRPRGGARPRRRSKISHLEGRTLLLVDQLDLGGRGSRRDTGRRRGRRRRGQRRRLVGG